MACIDMMRAIFVWAGKVCSNMARHACIYADEIASAPLNRLRSRNKARPSIARPAEVFPAYQTVAA